MLQFVKTNFLLLKFLFMKNLVKFFFIFPFFTKNFTLNFFIFFKKNIVFQNFTKKILSDFLTIFGFNNYNCFVVNKNLIGEDL